jgi:hypothetical protein
VKEPNSKAQIFLRGGGVSGFISFHFIIFRFLDKPPFTIRESKNAIVCRAGIGGGKKKTRY